MSDKPKDHKFNRKGESDGKRLTPGERVLNWSKALAVVIPLIGVGAAGNSETVKSWVFNKPLPSLPGEAGEIVQGGFEQQVEHAFKLNSIKFEEIEERLMQLESKSIRQDGNLQKQIDAIKELVN